MAECCYFVWDYCGHLTLCKKKSKSKEMKFLLEKGPNIKDVTDFDRLSHALSELDDYLKNATFEFVDAAYMHADTEIRTLDCTRSIEQLAKTGVITLSLVSLVCHIFNQLI